MSAEPTGTPRRVCIETRAKLNLSLAIGARRPDGYHDLVTCFQSVSLADTLIAWRRRAGFTLAVRFEDAAWPRHGASRRGRRGRARPIRPPAIPRGGDNLVLRAARGLSERLALPGGAGFELIKRIPVAAGLGGGSADAAAAVAAMLRLHGRRPRFAWRLALAAELGADVPFAMLGGTALGRGRGDRLQRVRLARPFRAIIAMPEWRVSTRDAFARWDRSKYSLTPRRSPLRFAQRVARNGLRLSDALREGNAFEKVLGYRGRDFRTLCDRMRACGLEEPRLTGSGSAVFGVLPEDVPFGRVIAEFEGPERLFAVRSVSAAMRFTSIR